MVRILLERGGGEEREREREGEREKQTDRQTEMGDTETRDYLDRQRQIETQLYTLYVLEISTSQTE